MLKQLKYQEFMYLYSLFYVIYIFLKYFWSTYYDFWRSCDTEDWSNDAENTVLITEINYSLQYITAENSYF